MKNKEKITDITPYELHEGPYNPEMDYANVKKPAKVIWFEKTLENPANDEVFRKLVDGEI